MKITPAHVHWFRFRQSGLVEPFSSPEQTARRLIGVQAQLLAAADLAFWNRTANCTRESLKEARLQSRSIVRFWGQRDTLHIYHTEDWPLLHTAFGLRQRMVRKRLDKAGILGEFQRVVRQTGKRLAAGKPLAYKDVKAGKLAEGIRREPMDDRQALWTAAYMTFRELEREGIACHGDDVGGRSTFVKREHWLPQLDWSPPSAGDAFAELAQRYLTAYGPAEPRDLAHWFGTTVTNATGWIESAGSACRAIEVDDRRLWCCGGDLESIAEKPPPPSRWPVRLLYRFDPLVLATKDKSWLIEDEYYKRVWRPSAHVEAVLLARGRIAGTWRYDRGAGGLHVRVSPFAKLSRAVLLAAEKQAAAIAGFLQLKPAPLEVVAV